MKAHLPATLVLSARCPWHSCHGQSHGSARSLETMRAPRQNRISRVEESLEVEGGT